jgi:hypothetical protein
LFIQKCATENCLSDSKELIQINEELMLDMTNLKIAREIYNSITPPPKTHAEWAEAFNKVGDIKKILDNQNKLK